MFTILLIIFIAANILRTAYEFLPVADRPDMGGRGCYMFILVSMIALWASWFNLCDHDPRLLDIPGALRWTGLGVSLAGLVLFFAAMIQIRGFNSTGRLITTGVFARLRHPMYVGFLLWLVGQPLFTQALTAAMLAPFGMVNVLIWRAREDKRLGREFPDYAEYRQRTWF